MPHPLKPRAVVATAAAALLLLAPAAVGATEPACAERDESGRSTVMLRVDGLGPSPRTELARQLRASLAERGLTLCPLEPGDQAKDTALAGVTVGVEDAGTDAVVVTVTVKDHLTKKRVARVVDLRGLPEDAQPLVLAQAADELLRASWAELLVKDAPPPARPVPAEVRRAVELESEPHLEAGPGPSRVLLDASVALAAEAFGTGQRQLGADLVLAIFPTERVGALVRGGPRAVDPRGHVDASAIAGAAAIAFVPIADARARRGVDLGPELALTQARYSVAGGRDGAAAAVHLGGYARGWVAVIGRLRAAASIEVGAPLHTVRVVAANESIAGVGGALVGGQLSLGGAW
jgi:hypothetical protein